MFNGHGLGSKEISTTNKSFTWQCPTAQGLHVSFQSQNLSDSNGWFLLLSTYKVQKTFIRAITPEWRPITPELRAITPAPGTEKMGKTQNKLLNLQLVVSALDFFQKVDQVVLKTLFTFEQWTAYLISNWLHCANPQNLWVKEYTVGTHLAVSAAWMLGHKQ